MDINDFGKLNGLCKQKQMFWGIKKHSWEDSYTVEVSSENYDSRLSLHEKVEFIDDVIGKMIKFVEEQ